LEQFLIFILIAIASLIFNRKKIANRQDHTETQERRTTAQPAQPIHEQRRDVGRPPVQQQSFPEVDLGHARNLKEVAEIIFTKAQPPMDKQEEARKQIEELEKRQEVYRTKAQSVRNIASNNQQKTDFAFRFQSEDVISGIVMAEVLGPPRSKKPYRRL